MISLKCCVWNMILRALKSYFKFQNPQILKWRNDPHPLNLGALSRFWSSKTHKFWSDGTTPLPQFAGAYSFLQFQNPKILKWRNDPHPLNLGALSRFWSSKTHKFLKWRNDPHPQFGGAWSFLEFQNPQILKWRSDPHPLDLGALTSFCEIKKTWILKW